MAEIHIFRHGETEWNLEGRIQGFKDSPLTVLGRLQAVDARSKIETIEFDATYASTSSRARDTARLLLDDQHIPIYELDDLREINMGQWEGMKHSDVKQRYSSAYFNFWNRPNSFTTDEGESFVELASRSVAVIEDIIKKHQGKKILIVSHAVFIKTLLTRLQSRSLNEIWKGPSAENLSHSILIGNQANGIYIKKFCDKVLANSPIPTLL